MLHKARLFIGSMAFSLVLIACADQSMEDTSNEGSAEETAEIQVDHNAETVENKETETTSADQAAADPAETPAETTNTAQTPEENLATPETAQQIATEQFIATTGLNVEDYSFIFETTDEYVEITVYEKQEEETAHTPRVGTYRYMLGSQEILGQDYLTGAFIPYEDLEE